MATEGTQIKGAQRNPALTGYVAWVRSPKEPEKFILLTELMPHIKGFSGVVMFGRLEKTGLPHPLPS